MMKAVLQAFSINKDAKVEAIQSGLINSTWKVTDGDRQYILQQINNKVFFNPENIAFNTRTIAAYLAKHQPGYIFTTPLAASNGRDLVKAVNGFFRMFHFVPGSHSKQVVTTPAEAWEAAAQFGRFTAMLGDFNTGLLKTTIPHFHDLSFRYKQFQTALENGNKERKLIAAKLIETLLFHQNIVVGYEAIKSDAAFRLRVTHHDTKISNVLFDATDKGICVIDLDTVMPGYFISDVGDMMRTYLSPVSEEEKDFDKIIIREDFYHAIVAGYCHEMKAKLSLKEQQYFFYAGTFMIYMQALRFMTDYLNNDIYYGAKYDGHNLVRANNNAVLLQRLFEKENVLKAERK